MPNMNLDAMRAAAAKKRRKGKGRKVSKAEKARVMAAAAVEEDNSSAATVGEGKRKGKAGQPWSQQRRANQARTDGSVKKVNPSPCDLEARAEAVCDREAWENAMEIMRERKCGWVHSRIVHAGADARRRRWRGCGA